MGLRDNDKSSSERPPKVWIWIAAAVLVALIIAAVVSLQQPEERVEQPGLAAGAEDGVPVYFFKVYGADREALHEEVSFHVAVPRDIAVLGQMRLLADKLSRFMFQRHPISVVRIEERDDGRIAIIDLREPDHPGAFTWRMGFFQGSTGGYFTTFTLTRTFLQHDYQGEWIDGVEFHYEGEPIRDEWDHIALHGTILREDLRPAGP